MKRPLLYCIPIVHNEADLGSLAADARRASGCGDEQAWQQKQAVIAQFWRGVASWCNRLPKDLSNYRIYQDGLPVCGHEREIVDDLAAKGSANHAIIRQLVSRGASLEGTESGPLLIEEYQLAKATLKGPTPTMPLASSPMSVTVTAPSRTAAAILRDRDTFIAQRVATTLLPGQTGLLFIGYLHDVLTKLPATFDVQKVTRPA